jgi:hyaluronan synthase
MGGERRAGPARAPDPSHQPRGGRSRRYRGPDPPVPLAQRQTTPGALTHHYLLPSVRYAGGHRLLAPVALTIALIAVRLVFRILGAPVTGPVLAFWLILFVLATVQLVLSCWDAPYTVTRRQARQLDRLYVVAAIPVYNEDPELLDRCIWSLVNSSHPPDVVHVVEDGPSADYSELRKHWLSVLSWTRLHWTQRSVNQGKKHAHAEAFLAHPEADIFITVDSDTAVEYHCVAEALKPFADRRVASVACIEEIINKRVNWLTMSVAARNAFFQLVVWGAQSALGELIVNRGTCALYRAPVIREIIPAYINETFLGHPIRLGDDSALTLFSRARGKTVQQVTAFSLPTYPENLSHHFRQRLRWARGSTIRHCWRLRYLPLTSYGFWFVVSYVYFVILSVLYTGEAIWEWPLSVPGLAGMVIGVLLVAFATGLRSLCVRRSDDTWQVRCWTCLLNPTAVLWLWFVVRVVRYYGILTCLKQGWTTRQAGVEVGVTVPTVIRMEEREPEEALI